MGEKEKQGPGLLRDTSLGQAVTKGFAFKWPKLMGL